MRAWELKLVHSGKQVPSYEYKGKPITARKTIGLKWKVHTPLLLQEILNNNSTQALVIPLQILVRLLCAVAERAAQLNDKQLNEPMLRLTLYEKADPSSTNYDSKLMREYGL